MKYSGVGLGIQGFYPCLLIITDMQKATQKFIQNKIILSKTIFDPSLYKPFLNDLTEIALYISHVMQREHLSLHLNCFLFLIPKTINKSLTL